MNYKRGLFRLWLVLSIFWIAGVAVAYGFNIVKHHNELSRISSPERFDSQSEPPTERQKLVTELKTRQLNFKINGLIKSSAIVALMPPIILFLFGVSLMWAIAGFKKKKPRESGA